MEKGQTNNPNGRPKGVANKLTTEFKGVVQQILSSNIKQVQQDIERLEPKERVDVFVKLLAYVLPKQQNIEAQINDITQRTPEEARRLLFGE